MGMKSAWNRGFRQYNNGWRIQQKPGSQLYTVYMEWPKKRKPKKDMLIINLNLKQTNQ